jgi:malonyl-CoA/methylmalonyl-CoA synthetase
VTLLNLFDLTLLGRKNEIALEFNHATYTFGDIEDRSNRTAAALRARGLEKGDRLCVYLVNSMEFIDLYLACVKLGVIFVPVNILYREREISHIVKDADPKAIVVSGDLPASVAVPVWQASELMTDETAERPCVTLDGDSPAAIVYTSGTTGASKGAVLTHNNFASNAVNLIACWQISAADRYLLALPLFHVHALGNALHTWLIAGFRMRMLERFEHQSAPVVFADFLPTLFFGVPTIYVRLLEWPQDTARAAGAKMRLFVCGSAPLPAQVLEEFQLKFGHRILERYGMTETLMNIGNPYAGERRAGTVGLPFPGVSVKIAEGELHVKGPNVFAGYWRRDEATAAAFVNGYFRTGDIGECSEDGYYTLRGRKSDLIISGGFNIYPREIEELLLEDPGVAEVSVVGVADRVRGELPVAYIVESGELDLDALEEFCRRKLASFKVPRGFVKVASLPRTALGKVQKHLLPVWKTD